MLTDVGAVELWATPQRRPSAAANPQGFCWQLRRHYALRHTRNADPPFGLAEENRRYQAFIWVSSLSLGVAQLSCLWRALASLALFQPIAAAVHFEDVDVVGQSVEQRTGQPLGADDFMMPPSSKELCVVLVFSTQRSAWSKG